MQCTEADNLVLLDIPDDVATLEELVNRYQSRTDLCAFPCS